MMMNMAIKLKKFVEPINTVKCLSLSKHEIKKKGLCPTTRGFRSESQKLIRPIFFSIFDQFWDF